MMKISFITPVYNAERYLTRCIESVLSVMSDEIELILVNDGSTDGSIEICKKYVEKDSRVKFITQKNLGVSAARNAGLKNAKGKYCFFLDADDYLMDKNVVPLINEAERDYDIVGFNHICLYENGFKKEELYSKKNEQESSKDFFNRQLLTTHMLHTCWGKLFKKSIIAQHNVIFPVDLKVGEDYIFVLEYCKYIETYKLINTPVLYYCVNSASVMQNYNKDARYETWVELMVYTENYYKTSGCRFDHEFYLYQLKTFTAMCRNIFLSCTRIEINEYMNRIKREERIQAIVNSVDLNRLGTFKRIEAELIKNNRWTLFKCYFIGKALIQRFRRDV